MILVNTDFISGYEVETLSMVKGSIIQSKHVGRDIMSALKSLIGGELTSYSEMINDARARATERMVEDAEKLNADAILNIRYSSSAVTQGAAEILVIGTAVKCIKK